MSRKKFINTNTQKIWCFRIYVYVLIYVYMYTYMHISENLSNIPPKSQSTPFWKRKYFCNVFSDRALIFKFWRGSTDNTLLQALTGKVFCYGIKLKNGDFNLCPVPPTPLPPNWNRPCSWAFSHGEGFLHVCSPGLSLPGVRALMFLHSGRCPHAF